VPARDAKTRTVPVYIAIFIFAQYVSTATPIMPTLTSRLFSMLYVYDALRARNVIQV
jgi:hypothetical protein